MKVKSESEAAQSCPTLSDPIDCSLPGSSIHGAQGVSGPLLSCVWNLRVFPEMHPGDFPAPGIEPRSPALQADSLPTELQGKPCPNPIHISKVLSTCSILRNLPLTLDSSS